MSKDQIVLESTDADTLRTAVDRLRAGGMSGKQAATEILRANIYDWAESESDDDGATLPRLRAVNPRD